MNIFGIGTPELIFIFVLVLVFIGPGQTVKSMRTMGVWVRKFRESTLWEALQRMWEIPAELAEEAGLEDFVGKPVGGRRKGGLLGDDIKKFSDDINKAWNMDLPPEETKSENDKTEPDGS